MLNNRINMKRLKEWISQTINSNFRKGSLNVLRHFFSLLSDTFAPRSCCCCCCCCFCCCCCCCFCCCRVPGCQKVVKIKGPRVLLQMISPSFVSLNCFPLSEQNSNQEYFLTLCGTNSTQQLANLYQ